MAERWDMTMALLLVVLWVEQWGALRVPTKEKRLVAPVAVLLGVHLG